MTDPARLSTCENCATALLGGYCHICGQHARNPLRHFGHAVEEVLESFWHLDGRIFRTLRDLFVPGRVAIDYLARHRVRYVAPLRLFIVLSLLTFFVGKLTLHLAPGDELRVNAGPSRESGIVIESDDVDSDPDRFRAAKSADEVLLAHAEIMKDIAAEERASGSNLFLSAILDLTRPQIDAQARQRLSELGASPEQLRRLDDAIRLRTSPGPGTTARSAAGDGVVARWLRSKVERINANLPLVRKNPDELIIRMLGALPGALLVLVPLFALCLKLFYVRSGRGYLEHLVIALYSHAFMLIALLLSFLLIGLRSLPGLPPWASAVAATLVVVLANLLLPLYLLWMQKRTYAQGWLKTFSKYVLVGMIYSCLLGLGLFYAVLAGLSS